MKEDLLISGKWKQSLNLGEGEILVVQVDDITDLDLHRLREGLAAELPDNRVIILRGVSSINKLDHLDD